MRVDDNFEINWNFFSFKKRGQGEIFGIALLFVVLILGVLIYSQIKALSPDNSANLENKYKNELLAQAALETILKSSSQCNVDGSSGYDTVQDLINTCLARARSGSDVVVNCPKMDGDIYLCSETIKIINNSLYNLFGDDGLIKSAPFFLEVDLPSNSNSVLVSTNITNFNNFTYRGTVINQSNFRKFKFKKASSDLKPWATAQRSIKMTLAIYYR